MAYPVGRRGQVAVPQAAAGSTAKPSRRSFRSPGKLYRRDTGRYACPPQRPYPAGHPVRLQDGRTSGSGRVSAATTPWPWSKFSALHRRPRTVAFVPRRGFGPRCRPYRGRALPSGPARHSPRPSPGLAGLSAHPRADLRLSPDSHARYRPWRLGRMRRARVPPGGLEPPISRSATVGSIHLSYGGNLELQSAVHGGLQLPRPQVGSRPWLPPSG